jgi:cell division protein FtsL
MFRDGRLTHEDCKNDIHNALVYHQLKLLNEGRDTYDLEHTVGLQQRENLGHADESKQLRREGRITANNHFHNNNEHGYFHNNN